MKSGFVGDKSLQISGLARATQRRSGALRTTARAAIGALALSAASCSPEQGPDPGGVAGTDSGTDSGLDAGMHSAEIGIPGGDDGLQFTALEAGGELRLQTFGQGGTHIFLGVRCIGFGSRAFVSITLTNTVTGAEVTSPPPVRPQLLFCREENICDLVPLLAMASGIAEPYEERHGLRIRVTAKVRNAAGLQAEDSREAVLSTADL